MTHLFYRDRLPEAPLYEMDAIDLRAKSKVAMPFGILCLSQHNLSVMFDRLPNSVFLRCGSNVDSWYPLTRQLRGSLTFLLRHRRDRENARRTLDTLRERFDIRCGPLPVASTS
jgi:hypothetical protein